MNRRRSLLIHSRGNRALRVLAAVTFIAVSTGALAEVKCTATGQAPAAPAPAANAFAQAAVAPGGPDLDQHGITGNWYNPATNGQGLSLEIFPNMLSAGQGMMFGGWFTFDVAPCGPAADRWYTIGGPVNGGQSSATLSIYRNVGGNFAAPPITQSQVVGSVTFTATACDSAVMSYTFTDGSNRSGAIPLTRLTPNVTCTMTQARSTDADFAHSGNWFSPSTSGQGFIFELNPSASVLFVTWYTYAMYGQNMAESQRWYTAKANYAAGARSFSLTLYETTGGTFNSSATAATTVPVGNATLSFANCNSASFAYNFTGGGNAGQAGTISLTRVGPVPSGCA